MRRKNEWSFPAIDVTTGKKAVQSFLMTRYMSRPDYDSLPAYMKQMYSVKEWAWLGEQGRENALAETTEPNYVEDR